LNRVARYWRFSKGPFDLTLPIQVAKGVKLKLKKPGDKDPEPARQAAAPGAPAEPEGFISFLPGWTQQ